MSKSITKPDNRVWYIAKNGTVVYGVVDTNQVMTTGLKNLEIFDNKVDWISSLAELGIDPSGDHDV